MLRNIGKQSGGALELETMGRSNEVLLGGGREGRTEFDSKMLCSGIGVTDASTKCELK